MENDPGSSSGSGMAYDGNQTKHPQKEEKGEGTQNLGSAPEVQEEEPKRTSHLRLVKSSDQIGMNEVLMNFKEKQKNVDAASPSIGLTVKYQPTDSTPAKGVLLNKKAE